MRKKKDSGLLRHITLKITRGVRAQGRKSRIYVRVTRANVLEIGRVSEGGEGVPNV